LIAHAVATAVNVEAMLMAVDLDNQTGGAALEIDNVRRQWRLPAKMMPN
jgi:hypothetical protein